MGLDEDVSLAWWKLLVGLLVFGAVLGLPLLALYGW